MAGYAHYCLHEFNWTPSFFIELDENEKAFVIASIDVKVEKEMEEKIKELAMTKRRDYFKSAESIASLLGKEFFVHRVGERNNDTQKDKQAAEQYVLGVIQRMIQDEVLDSSTAKDGTFVIRTIKEKERKKRTAAKANSLAMQA